MIAATITAPSATITQSITPHLRRWSLEAGKLTTFPPRTFSEESPMVRVTAAILLAAAPALASAQRVVPLTIENIQTRNRGVLDGVLSADGRWVAATVEGDSGRVVYLVAADSGDAAPRRVARGSAVGWFPDGASLLVSRDADLWVVGRNGAERRLTTGPEDERGAAVSPDGRWVAFFSGRAGSQDLWLVPAEGGEPRQLTRGAMAADDFRFAPVWSPSGSTIAYVSNAAEEWSDDLWLVEVASGAARQLSRGLMASTSPAWSSDGRLLALMSTSKRGYWYEDLADLTVVDPATGAERAVPMQVHASDWLHSQRVVWSNRDRTLLFPYLERGGFDLWAVSVSGGVATRVTNLGGAFRPIHGSAAGERVIFVRSTETSGPDLYLVDSRGGVPRQLTRFADRWDGVHEPEEISYRSEDGLYIQGFLYRPRPMIAGRRYPALVQVHGGGTNSYLRGRNLLEQYLAAKGYVVLAINYRGGSGFGRPFQDLSINDWANGQARDAAAAAGFIRAQSWSTGKVGIYGYSYGGIMSMAAIARAPNAFDAAVPMAGIYDFGDAYQNADRVGRIFIRTGHGGSPSERPEGYAVSNTLARLRDVRTPLLIMHGEADVRAPYRQYLLAVDSLKAYGKTFESKSYPGEPHGFRNPANRVDLYRRLEAFLDRHLKEPATGR
jgi:dipeptidyl aminopeptidase/acylaminoacyl peptidase